MNFILRKLKIRKIFQKALVFLSVFLFCSLLVSAAPIYSPGETLDPDCGPDDPDCTVAPPALSGVNTNITELSALTDATTTNLVVSSILRLPFLEGTILGVDQNGKVIATTTLIADPSWGAIGGALSAQTDLAAALAGKIDVGTTSVASILLLPNLTMTKSQISDFGSPLYSYTETDPLYAAASSTILRASYSSLSSLLDDSTHRLVTDVEKGLWNGKQDALGFVPVDSATTSMASLTSVGGLLTISGGNLGIATTSPFSTLSVSGTSGTSPFTVASSTGATMFTVLENGNVGIGKSDPQYMLDIYGEPNDDETRLRVGPTYSLRTGTAGFYPTASFSAVEDSSVDSSAEAYINAVNAKVEKTGTANLSNTVDVVFNGTALVTGGGRLFQNLGGNFKAYSMGPSAGGNSTATIDWNIGVSGLAWRKAGGAGAITNNIGSIGGAFNESGTGNITNNTGGLFYHYNAAANTITNSYGLVVEGSSFSNDDGNVIPSGGGTITNAYGVVIYQPTNTSGTLSNSYGLRLTGSSAAVTNKYALYIDSPEKNYFAGSVGIGTTTPFSTLSVSGTSGTSPFTVASSTGATMFTVLENGNVGIGKSDPQYTLDIEGTINAIAIRTPYEHTITVAKAGGDYTTITEALDAITDNDATHLYHIKVMPGVYTESITMKPYVDISGSGENSTVIVGDTGTAVTAAANSLLEKVTVKVSTAGVVLGVSGVNSDNFILRDAKVFATSSNNMVLGVEFDGGSSNVVVEGVEINALSQGTGGGAYGLASETGSVVYVYNSRITASQTGNQQATGILSYYSGPKVYIYNSDMVVHQTGTGPAVAIHADSGGDVQFVFSDLTVTANSYAYGFYFGVLDASDSSGLILGSKVSVAGSTSANDVTGIIDWTSSKANYVTVRDSIVTATNITGTGYGYSNRNGGQTKIFDSELTGIGKGSGKIGAGIRINSGTPGPYIQNSKLTGTGNSSASGRGVYVLSGGNATLINNQISGSTKDLVIDAGGTVNSSFNTYTSLTNAGTLRNVSSDLTTGNFLVSGKIGIGTSSPLYSLSVEGSSSLGNQALAGYFTATSTTATSTFAGGLTVNSNSLVVDYTTGNVGLGTATPDYAFQVYIDDSNEGHVAATGDWARTSDIRMKKNILTLEGALDKVMQLRGVRYDWVADEDAENSAHIGFIAQEVEALFPEFVDTGASGIKGVAYGAFTPVLLQAIKEQQGIILSMTRASTTGLIFASSTNAIEDRIAEITNELSDNFINYFEEKISNSFKLVKEFMAERVSAMVGYFGFVKAGKVHSLEGYETVDKATGDTYCIYMKNGEVHSALGACDEISVTTSEDLSLREDGGASNEVIIDSVVPNTPFDGEDETGTTTQTTEDLVDEADTTVTETVESDLEVEPLAEESQEEPTASPSADEEPPSEPNPTPDTNLD